MAKNLSPKYSNLALKYELTVPKKITSAKVPKTKIVVSLIYWVNVLLIKKSKSKLPSIKKYNKSASIGSAILSPIIGAK